MKKLFAFLAISIFSMALIFTVFPVEYSKLLGNYEHAFAANRIALRLTDFYVRNGLKYRCGSEMYFAYGTPFGGEVPGILLQTATSLEAERKVTVFFLSDAWIEEYDEFVEDLRKYNLFLSTKCPR
ncbi:hypothetical protein [Rhizobium leguminosarum]|uniref:hypothetical protein n=1 Tax=Rhizobium leguminosarum TaxID=384 RepID=UPI001C957FAE|nr:hypothetical protein [Rhizobium leguminosarum]MBY5562450.1 hypothetical protein [Rhizobium leguminosarum]MBY5709552.1 hypothetical protein [Rhizobium leguminosarum]MBY5756046.1 hypothetical protein [Rhizobium leguminosarum]